jgi:hypothetical protein
VKAVNRLTVLPIFAALVACATPVGSAAEAQRASDCMAAALERTGRAEDVRADVVRRFEGYAPRLGYTFRGETGDIHTVWVEPDALRGGLYAFAAADFVYSRANPANSVLEEWESSCHVVGVLITA